MKQLERFESSPSTYRPEGELQAAGLVMTAALLDEFWEFQVSIKGTSRKHANEKHNRLIEWMEDFAGRDIRKVSLRDHVKPAIERRKTSRQHRIISLKSFFAWLRVEKNLITTAEDCTLDLPVPQAKPEKWKRRKVVDFKHVQAAAQHLPEKYLQCLQLLVATGWHVTELERFARQAESQIVVPHERTMAKDGRQVLGVLVTVHKLKELTRTPILNARQLNAAQEIKKRGTIPRYLNKHLKEACVAAGVPVFTFGVMRHSVATWAIESGAAPDQVAEFLGHKDKRTTLRFYADVAVPTVAVSTYVLPDFEPEDSQALH
jgi:integrase